MYTRSTLRYSFPFKSVFPTKALIVWVYLCFTCVTLHLFGVIRRHDHPDKTYVQNGESIFFQGVGRVISSTTRSTGTLIHPRWVVTTGHSVTPGKKCLFLFDKPDGSGTIGVQGTPIQCPAYAIEIGEDRKIVKTEADLALIFLDDPIELTPLLPLTFREDLVGKFYLSAGFGQAGTGDGELYFWDDQKRAFSNTIYRDIDEEWCGHYYLSLFDAPDTSNCTLFEGFGKSGDSGAPILVWNKGRYEFVGILTFSAGDGSYGSVNGILSFAEYRDWLEQYLSF